MSDIQLDFVTGRFVRNGLDIKLTDANSAEEVGQACKIALQFHKGEDPTNLDNGIDYMGELVGKVEPEVWRSEYVAELQQIPSVRIVNSVVVEEGAANSRSVLVHIRVNGTVTETLEF